MHGERAGDYIIQPEPEEIEMIRESQVGVILSIDKAESIAKWMLEKVEEFRVFKAEHTTIEGTDGYTKDGTSEDAPSKTG